MAEALTFDAGAISPSSGETVRRSAERAAPADQGQTFVLAVENMVCGGCMRKVETALAAVPDVTLARANLSMRRVSVIAKSSTVTAERLIAALGAIGFKSAEVVEHGDAAVDKAERDLMFRLGVAGFGAANVMLLSVSIWSADASGGMTPAIRQLFEWLSALVALPCVVYAGQPFFRSAFAALSNRRINMDVPISLGVTLATGMSLYETAAGDGHVYFDAAVMLLFFLLIGRFLDTRMRARAAGAAANLLAMRALTADVIGADGSVSRVPARALQPGMLIQVAPGERVAVDGKVVDGISDVDMALITGESTPVRASGGTPVYAGAVNLSGRITVRADAVEDRTLLSEIGRMMAAAEQGRGQYVRLADRAAAIYAPAVHILGAATFIGWMLMGSGWEPALTAAIAVLIITCPCALALAVPAVQVAATSRLFDRGALIKAADGLERLSECDTIVFDKTGTLTTGAPRLRDPEPAALDRLAAATALAATSRHPYSVALVAAARARGIAVTPATAVVEHPGEGLSLMTEPGEVRLGSADFCGVPVETADAATLWFRPADGAPVPFDFEDEIKADAAETVARLVAAGFDVEILSGDRPVAVEAIARRSGIVRWTARATPADKVARLDALKAQGRKVLMVGDGLNDAPALASGHASLSPSEAADISQTSADGVFRGGLLSPVVETVAVSRAAQRMALQNFAIALGYNLVFVPLAVMGHVTPLIAAIAMSASSIAVTANAIRLRTRRLSM